MRPIALAVLLLLAACSPLRKAEVAAEPVVEEPAFEATSPEACAPGDDDGIGGTGCRID